MNGAKTLLLFCLLASLLLLSGCLTYKSDFVPPGGGIYTKTRAPITTRFEHTPVCKDCGESSTYYFKIPFLNYDFAFGDCSIEKAAEKGNLKKVEYADGEFMQILGVFGHTTIIAYGNK